MTKSTSSRKKLPNKTKFLLSRKALLKHLEKQEKLLHQKVTAFRPKDPVYQEKLIRKYLNLQEDLAELKKLVKKSNTQTQTKPKDILDKQTITKELKLLLDDFSGFLEKTGFAPTKA